MSEDRVMPSSSTVTCSKKTPTGFHKPHKMVINEGIERKWEKLAMTYCNVRVLSYNFLCGNEMKYAKSGQG